MKMLASHIINSRLHQQQISAHKFKNPVDVVSWLGAMQAQDHPGAKWSVALRLPNAMENDIDRAIAGRKIIRTWLMRGTLHFVAAEDIRWMLKLLASRVISSAASRHRQLELDEKVFKHARKIIINALQDDKQLTRDELYVLLEESDISTEGQRGIHILRQLALEGLTCFATHQGKQPSFALMDDWVPAGKKLTKDEALAELTLRYFTGHGPATLHDFAWWSGLRISDVKKGLEIVSSQLTSITFNKDTYWMQEPETKITSYKSATIFLLPGFDAYMLGYKNRSIILDTEHAEKIVPGNNGMFQSTIIINGRVNGLWKRTIKKNKVRIDIEPFANLHSVESKAIRLAAKRYADYLGKSLD